MCLINEEIIANVCSAVEMVFPFGAFITITPCFVLINVDVVYADTGSADDFKEVIFLNNSSVTFVALRTNRASKVCNSSSASATFLNNFYKV